MSLPWFPFHVNAYVSDTMALTTEGHGAYLLLMLHYYATEKPLPDRDTTLAAICKMSVDRWLELRPDIETFFQIGDGVWRHARIEAEIEKARGKYLGKVSAGEAGSKARWQTPDKTPGGMSRSERLSAARAKGTHTKQQWEKMLAFCGTACLSCGNNDLRLVKDHVTPIYQGGSDSISNIQPLCQTCNSKKGSYVHDFRPSGWQDVVLTPIKTPSESQTNARRTPIKTSAHIHKQDIDGGGDAGAREAVKKSEPDASPLGGLIPIDRWNAPPIDPADTDLFHAFANKHMDAGTFSADWPSLWETYRKDATRKTRKPPPVRVELNKRPEPIPGQPRKLISDAAYALAKEVAAIMGVTDHPVTVGMPYSMEVWLDAWPHDLILIAVQEVMDKRRASGDPTPPDKVRYFEKAIARKVAEMARPLPVATLTTPQDTAHGRQNSKSVPAAAERLAAKLSALTGGGAEHSGGEGAIAGGTVHEVSSGRSGHLHRIVGGGDGGLPADGAGSHLPPSEGTGDPIKLVAHSDGGA